MCPDVSSIPYAYKMSFLGGNIMKIFTKLFILYTLVAIIPGCAVLIDTLFSGSSVSHRNPQEPVIIKPIDHAPEPLVKNNSFTDIETYISNPELAPEITPPETSPPYLEKNQPKTICTGEKVTKYWHELKRVVVVTDVLNIRSHYGSNQPIIGGAKRCEQLIVLDKHVERIKGNNRIKSRGWLKVKSQKGTTGWVAGWLTEYIGN